MPTSIACPRCGHPISKSFTTYHPARSDRIICRRRRCANADCLATFRTVEMLDATDRYRGLRPNEHGPGRPVPPELRRNNKATGKPSPVKMKGKPGPNSPNAKARVLKRAGYIVGQPRPTPIPPAPPEPPAPDPPAEDPRPREELKGWLASLWRSPRLTD